MSNCSKTCECHKINWMSIVHRGEYEMLDGSPVQMGVSCDDKVEIDHMTEGDYEAVCKYIPGNEDSRFPQEVLQYLLDANAGSSDRGDAVRGDADRGDAVRGDAVRGDADRGDAEEGSSVKSLAWWQEPGDTCSVGWEQQTLDPILLALNSKVSIK